jgi:hypothetical protein
MKTTKTVNKATTNNKDYEVKNEVFSKTKLKAICEFDISFTVEQMDNFLSNAHNKPLLNTMTKEKKVEYTVFYLLLLYQNKINSHKKELIRRFKYDNENIYDKENDCFDDVKKQLQYLSMKKELKNINDDIKNIKDKTINSSKVNTLYKHYVNYQYGKNSTNKTLYRDIYMVHIAKWLCDLNIKPSMQTLEYLADDVSTVINKKVRVNKKDDNSLDTKIAMKSNDFATNFIYTLVQAMLDNGVINVNSYVTNVNFMHSLKGLEVQNSVEFLQNAMQDIELSEV